MQIDGQGNVESGSSGSPEGMTAAELAYMNSGGKDTSALEAEWASQSSGEGQGEPSSQQAGADTQDQQNAADGDAAGQDDDDDGDGEEVIIVGKDGKPRAKNNGRFVPHQALHKERERRKATEGELQQARELAARANERIAVFTDLINKSMTPAEQQAQQQGQEQDDPAPDPEKDIFGFVKWQGRQIERLSKQLDEKSGKFEQHTAEQRFRSAYVSDAQAFMATTPDFRDAYKFLAEGVDKELIAIGMTDAGARKAHIAAQERAIAEAAMKQRVSPSQVIYNLAQARGYAPKAPTQNQNENQGSDPAKKIEQIANGQKQAGNPLSNAGGSSGEGLTVEAFLSMNETEYAAAVAKLSPSQRRALLGG